MTEKMKTLIVYGSVYGTTATCAKLLAEELEGEVVLVNLDENPAPGLSEFETVVMGTPIYIGQVNQNVRKFCDTKLSELKKKTIGVFICAGHEDEVIPTIKSGLGAYFPENAKAIGYFGYEYKLENMKFWHKLAIRIVAKVKESDSQINLANIKSFAQRLTENVPGKIVKE